MNRQVVSLERLTQVTLPHEDITLVSGPTGLQLAWPPSFHESLHEHVRLTRENDLRPAHPTALRRVRTVPAVRVTATGGHRLEEGAFAQRTREGRFGSPSGDRSGTDHVLEKRARQMLESLHWHRGCSQTLGIDPDGLLDAAALGQGIAVTEQHLARRSLLLQASLVQLDRQVVVTRGERLLGKLGHRALCVRACTYHFIHTRKKKLDSMYYIVSLPLVRNFSMNHSRDNKSDIRTVRATRPRASYENKRISRRSLVGIPR